MRMNRGGRAFLAGMLFLWGVFLPCGAAAEEMRIEIVVGFAAGGSTDLAARFLADTLLKEGIRADVVNMPGGSGTVGAAHVARMPPDSGVFILGTPTALIFEPATGDRGFDIRDFDAVAMVGNPTFSLAARSDAPFGTWEELLAYMEANPGKVRVGGQGERSVLHFYLTKILDDTRYQYEYVPLAGGADVARNLMEGNVDAGHLSLAAALPLREEGNLTVFVNTQVMLERDPLIPEIPNVTEKGIDAAEPRMICLFAPRGTNPATIRKLSSAIERACMDEELRENFRKNGIVAHYLSPEDTRNLFMMLQEEVIPEFRAWLRRIDR